MSSPIKFSETPEEMKKYNYWMKTMDQVYKGDYMVVPDKQSTEYIGKISYWQDTMSKVYEFYPDMAK